MSRTACTHLDQVRITDNPTTGGTAPWTGVHEPSFFANTGDEVGFAVTVGARHDFDWGGTYPLTDAEDVFRTLRFGRSPLAKAHFTNKYGRQQ